MIGRSFVDAVSGLKIICNSLDQSTLSVTECMFTFHFGAK